MSRMIFAPRAALALLLAAGMAIISWTVPANAQRGQWERIASKKVNMLADRDVIELDRTDGRFNALRFNAVRGNINIYRIRVTYGNGEKQDLDLDKKIREGEDSGPIDLSGKARVIDKIEMLYASSNLLKRAQLEVFGRVRPGTKQATNDSNRRTPSFEDDDTPRLRSDESRRRQDNFDDEPLRRADTRGDDRDDRNRSDRTQRTAPIKIGQRYVDLDFDSDRIWIGRADGNFGEMSVRASGGDIRIRDLKVVYGDGETDTIRVRKLMRDGVRSQPFKLNPERRGIRRIEVTYRRQSGSTPPVLLKVYAVEAEAREGGQGERKAVASDNSEDRAEAERDMSGWQVLGSRDVDLSLDRDVIRIERGEGPFTAIALRARGSAVMVFDIRVTFGNGKRQTFRVDERLRPGRKSRDLDLKGNARRITKVELLYEKARIRGRKAKIEVLARKAERRADTVDRGTGSVMGEDGLVRSEPKPRGWSSVGRRILNARSTDGKIGPAGHVERFSEVVFRVVGGPIRINTATLQFRNGSTMRLRMNSTMRDGDKTNPVKFKNGRARRIEGIVLDYEPLRGRREAMVEVIGKQAER